MDTINDQRNQNQARKIVDTMLIVVVIGLASVIVVTLVMAWLGRPIHDAQWAAFSSIITGGLVSSASWLRDYAEKRVS
jgi:hypothetical protein